MTLHKDGSSAVLNVALEKEGEKKKKSYYNKGYSYLVTHPSTDAAQQGLTLLSGRNMLKRILRYTEIFFKNALSVDSLYHKESNMFCPLNKVKPCWAASVLGWVTKYE